MAVEQKATIESSPESTGLPADLYNYLNPNEGLNKKKEELTRQREALMQRYLDEEAAINAEYAQAQQQLRSSGANAWQLSSVQRRANPYQAQLNNIEAELGRTESALRGQEVDAEGRPVGKQFFSLIDPKTGLLYSQYQVAPKTLDDSKLAGYQAVKQRALSTGPSAWAQLMLEKQKAEELAARDAAARQAATQAAQARGQLAMRGGLRGGARERLAQYSMRDALAARQDVAKQGIGSRFGILTEDESQRMKLLPQFAEQEGKLAEYNLGLTNNAQKYNIEQALKEKAARDEAEMQQYQERMKGWAAEKEAQATASQGGGGGGGK